MVHIYTAHCDNHRYPALVQDYRQWLTVPMLKKASAFRQEIDATRYLLGKILLLKAMALHHPVPFTLDQLQEDAYSKPHFPGAPHFNISHSGNYVLCAMSSSGVIGVDVEHVHPVEVGDFEKCFTGQEWTVIHNDVEPLQAFFRFWTRKEAVMKADGRGMHIELLSFEVINDQVLLDGRYWHLQELRLADDYCAHLATPEPLQEQYQLQELL